MRAGSSGDEYTPRFHCFPCQVILLVYLSCEFLYTPWYLRQWTIMSTTDCDLVAYCQQATKTTKQCMPFDNNQDWETNISRHHLTPFSSLYTTFQCVIT